MNGSEILLHGNQVEEFSPERSGNPQYGMKGKVGFISRDKFMALFLILPKGKKKTNQKNVECKQKYGQKCNVPLNIYIYI